jgi:hypothetical protein
MKSNYIMLITSLILSSLAEKLLTLKDIHNNHSAILYTEGVLLDAKPNTVASSQGHKLQAIPTQRTHQLEAQKRQKGVLTTSDVDLEEIELDHTEEDTEKELQVDNKAIKEGEISLDKLTPYVKMKSEAGIWFIGRDRKSGLFTFFHTLDENIQNQRFQLDSTPMLLDLAIIELKLMKLKTVEVSWGIELDIYNLNPNANFHPTFYVSKEYLLLEPNSKKYRKLPEFFKTDAVEQQFNNFGLKKRVAGKKLLIKVEFQFLKKIELPRYED